jgi:tetratricopeptide (TPR) repeat protein
MDRGDWGAARGLLRRARSLLPTGSDERALLGPDLALALQEIGDNAEALAVAGEAARARDPIIRARGAIARADTGYFFDHDSQQEFRRAADEARKILEAAGDDLGLAQYWRVDGFGHWARLQAAAARDSWERGLVHARAAGARRLEVEMEGTILSALVIGPTPAAEALPQAQHALERAAPGSLVEASAGRAVAKLLSFQGAFAEARELHARGRRTLSEAGLTVTAAGSAMSESEIEWRAGDHEEQERLLRGAVETLDELGDQFYYSTVALRLAECLLLSRPPDDGEVVAICEQARERSLAGDLVNFVYLDAIEARRLAWSGSTADASALARRATETSDTTDNVECRSEAWYALCATLTLIDEVDEARRAAARSIEIRMTKGDVAGAAALERRYRELGVQPA